MRAEHLKILLPDAEALDVLYCAAQLFATARIPADYRLAVALGRMVALQKSGAQRRVRGIVVGDTFRRIVAKTLARQFAPEIGGACAPMQSGVATKAGTDCIVQLLRGIPMATRRRWSSLWTAWARMITPAGRRCQAS